MKQWVRVACALFSLAASSLLHAAGLVIVSEPERSGQMFVHPRPGVPQTGRPGPQPHVVLPHRHFSFAPLELASLQVNARIQDQFVSTVVEQEFYNPNAQAVEGTFVFPLPKGAQIEKFTMEIAGRPVEAELLDSEKARRFYEDIVRKAKDPALLEYAGREMLKARIFPIDGHGRKRVTVTYSQLLKLDSGLVSYAFPLDAGKFSSRPVQSVSLKVELEAKRPLKSIYSPTHTIEVRRHGAHRATVGYESANLKPDSDFQLFFAAEREELGFSFLAHRTGSDDGFFLLLASPGFGVSTDQVLAKDVAFVLDTSGSMAGAKLEQAKKALAFCVENLNDDDRFEIIRFATEAEPLFDGLTVSSSENRKRAREFIQELKPIGGTAIDEALRKALALRPPNKARPYIIVFLTDGRPTVGVTNEDTIVASVSGRKEGEAKASTRIFCFGIGTDVNTHLLDRITEQTHAFSQYVLPEEDIEVKVSAFFSKIKEPVLADVTLKSSGSVRLSKMYPSDLPDLFQGEQLAVVGRYSTAGDGTLTLEGRANLESKRFPYSVRFPERAADHEFISRIWATRRVGYLLDEIRLRGESQELRQEVTELARQFGLVTPYTAYLILEDEARRGVPLARQSLPQLQSDQSAQEAARRYYSTANEARTGPTAVLSSRYGLAMKQADNFQALGAGTREAERALSAGAPMRMSRPAARGALPASEPDSADRLLQYTQQSQFVNGRNFFRNGGQWVDSSVQNQADAARVKIQFNSPEYFDLLAKHPKVAPWLALGSNLQFAYEGKVYEIADDGLN